MALLDLTTNEKDIRSEEDSRTTPATLKTVREGDTHLLRVMRRQDRGKELQVKTGILFEQENLQRKSGQL